MPTPTTLSFWGSAKDVLKNYAKGWQGDETSLKTQKQLELKKVKAEMSYSASDYFSMIYEKIACSADINMTDLSGTELEAAETEVFKNNIKESLRATFWVGSATRKNKFNTFDGIIKKVMTSSTNKEVTTLPLPDLTTAGACEKLFKDLWDNSSVSLRSLKNDGNLVFFATTDIIDNYEQGLYSGANDTARTARLEGISNVLFRGIPVEDVNATNYLLDVSDLPPSFVILTDRRNLALAVNTRDMPGSEVAMWYNPDELENRQRATFLAAADYLLPELITTSFTAAGI